MRPEEATAIGELAGEGFGGTASRIEELHRAVARRAFEGVGVVTVPVRAVHDGVAAAVYGAVRAAGGALVRAAGLVVGAVTPQDAPPLIGSPRGSAVVGALDGVVGDRLERFESALALPMTIRRNGEDLELAREALARAFPDAGSRVALFVHGLCESDEAWRGSYGNGLQRDVGYTPLYLRYNTGLHVSENGRRLAHLLDDLDGAWPEPLEEIVVVGHSMGGLVGRSACRHGQDTGQAWVR